MLYVTISYKTEYPNAPTKEHRHVLLATPDGIKFYHPEGGPSHFTLSDYELEETHGYYNLGDENDSRQVKRLVIKNAKKYHSPEKETKPTGGWLAPNGDFYPCESWLHDWMAESICRAVLGKLEGTRYLEQKQWIRVHDNGNLGTATDDPLTQAQRNALFDLYTQSDNCEYKKNIEYWLDEE